MIMRTHFDTTGTSMQNRVVIAVAILLLSFAIATPEEEGESATTFRDLKDKVIVGQIHKPLGTIVTVEGFWEFDEHREPKRTAWYFVIVTIDNKQVGSPIRFRRSDVRFATDDLRQRIAKPFDNHPIPEHLLFSRITMRVYESIEHRGHPAGFQNEAGLHIGPGNVRFELVTIMNCASGDISSVAAGKSVPVVPVGQVPPDRLDGGGQP